MNETDMIIISFLRVQPSHSFLLSTTHILLSSPPRRERGVDEKPKGCEEDMSERDRILDQIILLLMSYLFISYRFYNII